MKCSLTDLCNDNIALTDLCSAPNMLTDLIRDK